MVSKPFTGLKAQLFNFLKKDGGWVHKGKLTADMVWRNKAGMHYGARYMPETVGRALRLLEEQGQVAVKEDGISIAYKALYSPWKEKYIPFSERTVKSKIFK